MRIESGAAVVFWATGLIEPAAAVAYVFLVPERLARLPHLAIAATVFGVGLALGSVFGAGRPLRYAVIELDRVEAGPLCSKEPKTLGGCVAIESVWLFSFRHPAVRLWVKDGNGKSTLFRIWPVSPSLVARLTSDKVTPSRILGGTVAVLMWLIPRYFLVAAAWAVAAGPVWFLYLSPMLPVSLVLNAFLVRKRAFDVAT